MRIGGKTAVVLIIVTMMLSIIQINPTVSAEGKALGQIAINSNSYIELHQVLEFEGDQNKIVTFDVSFVNNGNNDIQLIDYWAQLKNKAGASYSIQLTEESSKLTEIVANSTSRLTFYSMVPKTEKINNLIFEWIQWDFSTANYQRKLGQIVVPVSYTYVNPAGEPGAININGTSIKTSAAITSVIEGIENNDIELTLELENSGSRGVTLPEYSYYIRTKDDLIYKLDKPESTDSILQPRIEKELVMTTTIPNSIELGTELQLVMTQTQGSVELPVGYFALAKSDRISLFSSKVISLNNSELSVSAERASVSEDKFTVVLNYENTGNQDITLPTYLFVLEDNEGKRYILTSELTETSINAKESREVILTTTLTSEEVNPLDLLLIMEKKDAEKEAEYVATFELPTISGLSKSYNYTNDDGTYKVTLNGLQRLPYGDQDLLAADVTITNTTTHILPLIDLSAYIKMNGLEINNEDIVMVNKDNIISLAANASTNIIIYTKIPYTYVFDNMTLGLEEKVSEQSTKTIAIFKETNTSFALPVIADSATYTIDNVGKRANLKVMDSYTYSGDYTDLFYTEVELENTEKRLTDIVNLVGYYKTSEDVYYPASITEVKDKVLPNGKLLLALWSKLPKGYELNELDIIIGEQASAEDAEAFIKAVQLEIRGSDAVAKKINNMSLYPYNVQLSNFIGRIQEEERRIEFDYEVAKDYKYALVQGDHKLVIEIVDTDDKIQYNKELTLETDLELGEDSYEFSIPFKNIRSYFGGFTVNVYDQFDGHKRLIASDHLSWNQVYYQKHK